MVLRDTGDVVVDKAYDTSIHGTEGQVNMSQGFVFTFDTKSVDPTDKFHVPSLLRDRSLQRAALKIARKHPQVITVGDYRKLSFTRLKTILSDLGFAPSFADRFHGELTNYLGSWR